METAIKLLARAVLALDECMVELAARADIDIDAPLAVFTEAMRRFRHCLTAEKATTDLQEAQTWCVAGNKKKGWHLMKADVKAACDKFEAGGTSANAMFTKLFRLAVPKNHKLTTLHKDPLALEACKGILALLQDTVARRMGQPKGGEWFASILQRPATRTYSKLKLQRKSAVQPPYVRGQLV